MANVLVPSQYDVYFPRGNDLVYMGYIEKANDGTWGYRSEYGSSSHSIYQLPEEAAKALEEDITSTPYWGSRYGHD